MKIIYEDNDLVSAYNQKQRIYRLYLIVAIFYGILCVSCLLYFISLPYQDPHQAIPKWIVWITSCIFVIFSYIYMGIKFHRARRYYKLVSYLSVGMKQVNKSFFLRYEDTELKDGVDFNVLIMSEWSNKKSEYMERKIFCDKEKPLPEFMEGDVVCYLTQGNFMIEYEVVGHDDEFAKKIASGPVHERLFTKRGEQI